MLFCRLLIFVFQNTYCLERKTFTNTIRILNSLADESSGLIWDQTVCQGYQQTTLVDKALMIKNYFVTKSSRLSFQHPINYMLF